jgi:DNA-binding response OmpR family regulator
MSRTKILLVNGDATVQHLRALMLRMRGYDVDTAATLDAAHEKISDRKHQLVIVDVGHFAGLGLTFCEEVKKKHPELKVLMQANGNVSSDPDSCPDKVISRQEGPQHFINEVESILQTASS